MADKNQYSDDTSQEDQGNKGGQATDFENEGEKGAQEDSENMGNLE